MSWLTGGSVSGTPIETRGGTELLANVFEDVLRTGDFGRLGAQGFGFAAFPGGGRSSTIGPSLGRSGQGGGLVTQREALVRGKGFTRGDERRESEGSTGRRARPKGGTSESRTPDSAMLEDLGRAVLAFSTLPGFQTGGVIPRGRPAIVGEAGPEIVQETGAGTQVTPMFDNLMGLPPRSQQIQGGRDITALLGGLPPGTQPRGIPEGITIGPPTGGPGSQPIRFPSGNEPSRGGAPGGGVVLPGPAGRGGAGAALPPVEQTTLDILQAGAPGGSQVQGFLNNILGRTSTLPSSDALISAVQRGGVQSPQLQALIGQIQGGGALSPEVQSLLGQVQGGGGIPSEVQSLLGQVQGAGGISPEVQRILGSVMGGANLSPEARAAQSQLLGGGTGVTPEVQRLLSSIGTLTGGGPEAAVPGAMQLNEALFAALEPFEQRQAEQQAAQLREGFSTTGGRFSRELAGAESQLRGELAQGATLTRAQNLQNTLNTLLQNQQASAATQAGLVSPLLQAAGQQGALQQGALGDILQTGQQGLATQAGLVSPLLGAQTAQAGNLASLVSPLLGAQASREGNLASLIAPLLGAQGQQTGALTNLTGQLLGAQGQQTGSLASILGPILGLQGQATGDLTSLAQSLLGAEQEQLRTQAGFVPDLMGQLTQSQLASLAPLELIARFFSPGQAGFQQGILGDILRAGGAAVGAFA